MTVAGRSRLPAVAGVAPVLAAADAWLAAEGDPLRGEAAVRLVAAAVRCHPNPAAEAVVLLVDHQVLDLGAITSSAPYILDCRYAASGAVVESL